MYSPASSLHGFIKYMCSKHAVSQIKIKLLLVLFTEMGFTHAVFRVILRPVRLLTVNRLTCNGHRLGQTERDRLPVRIVKLCHSLRVPVDLGQEHALAAGATQQTHWEKWKTEQRAKNRKSSESRRADLWHAAPF